MSIKEYAFDQANYWISHLLEMYEIDIDDPDVMQNVVNCAVCIDNAYNGFDENGNKNGETK